MAALYGPLHGGANEQVLRMLWEIGSTDQIPGYIERVKKGEFRLMGFGHRMYKNFDPRARSSKDRSPGFRSTGRSAAGHRPEMGKIALEDEYFVSRKLYPNVDFYRGSSTWRWDSRTYVHRAVCDRPPPGWLAHWEESVLGAKEQKITRPRQLYTGAPERHLNRHPRIDSRRVSRIPSDASV